MPRVGVELAVQAPAANANVREEQHDEDDCEDDVEQHWPPVLSKTRLSCEVLSGCGAMSPPYGGFESDVVGVELGRERSVDRSGDDFVRGGVLRADAVTEHERCEPRHVLNLDGVTTLSCRACLRRG